MKKLKKYQYYRSGNRVYRYQKKESPQDNKRKHLHPEGCAQTGASAPILDGL